MFGFHPFKTQIPRPEQALPGRDQAIQVHQQHVVLGHSTVGPWPGMSHAMFGLGCFWGAERKFWTAPGVISTQVGYAAGHTPNPTYREVCSGRTGHNGGAGHFRPQPDVVFSHAEGVLGEPQPHPRHATGQRRGYPIRSGIYVYDEAQRTAAEASKATFGEALKTQGFPVITTEILDAPVFYYAEDYHQQYLYKNPSGYCGLGGTGVSCQIGLDLSDSE